jgi:hypothetical protein
MEIYLENNLPPFFPWFPPQPGSHDLFAKRKFLAVTLENFGLRSEIRDPDSNRVRPLALRAGVLCKFKLESIK